MSLPNKQERLKVLCLIVNWNRKGKATMIYSLSDIISAHHFAQVPTLKTSFHKV